MKQNDLARAVARVTGDSVSTAKRIGFLLEPDPEEHLPSEVLSAQVIDWDLLEQTDSFGSSARRSRREAAIC